MAMYTVTTSYGQHKMILSHIIYIRVIDLDCGPHTCCTLFYGYRSCWRMLMEIKYVVYSLRAATVRCLIKRNDKIVKWNVRQSYLNKLFRCVSAHRNSWRLCVHYAVKVSARLLAQTPNALHPGDFSRNHNARHVFMHRRWFAFTLYT